MLRIFTKKGFLGFLSPKKQRQNKMKAPKTKKNMFLKGGVTSEMKK